MRLSVLVLCGNDDPIATSGLAALAKKEKIHLEPRFSDHAPLLVDHDFSL